MISVDSIQKPTPTTVGTGLSGGDYSSTQPAGTNTYASIPGGTTANYSGSGTGTYLPVSSLYPSDRTDRTPYAGLGLSFPGGVSGGGNVAVEPINFGDVFAPTGPVTSPSTSATMTTTEPSELAQVLANLGSMFGSSASGGSGAASPGSVTAVPVGAGSSSTGSPMNKILLLAIVVGVGYYGYKKGWFSKLGAAA